MDHPIVDVWPMPDRIKLLRPSIVNNDAQDNRKHDAERRVLLVIVMDKATVNLEEAPVIVIFDAEPSGALASAPSPWISSARQLDLAEGVPEVEADRSLKE